MYSPAFSEEIRGIQQSHRATERRLQVHGHRGQTTPKGGNHRQSQAWKPVLRQVARPQLRDGAAHNHLI